MTPPAASVASRRKSVSRRRASVRRRRRLSAVVVVLILGIVLLMPLFRRAVSEFGLPLSYSSIIRQQAAEKHLDPALIAAVIYAETKFDPRTSAAGAEGLMQMLPQTAMYLAHRSGATTFHVSDLGTPQVNIAYGSYYLRYLLNEYSGSEMLALAAYNAGEANVTRWDRSESAEGRPMTISEIPFPETRAYVAKVLSAQLDYRRTYAAQLGY